MTNDELIKTLAATAAELRNTDSPEQRAVRNVLLGINVCLKNHWTEFLFDFHEVSKEVAKQQEYDANDSYTEERYGAA